jgi:hypothetical protein
MVFYPCRRITARKSNDFSCEADYHWTKLSERMGSSPAGLSSGAHGKNFRYPAGHFFPGCLDPDMLTTSEHPSLHQHFFFETEIFPGPMLITNPF